MDVNYLSKIIEDIGLQKEALIMKELNELISRGLLVLEETEMKLVRDQDSNAIKLSQGIVIKLKDQEYIEQLEKENSMMKEKLDKLKASFETSNE